MSNMVSYITTQPTENAGRDGGVQFNIKALHPFDAMKVVLEQAIYANYLLNYASSTHTVLDIIKNTQKLLWQLPSRLSYDNVALSSLYENGMAIARAILDCDVRQDKSLSLDPRDCKDLYAIFNQPVMKKYINREYVPTIVESFLTVWISARYGVYDTEVYPNAILPEAVLLIPSAVVVKNYNPLKATSQHNEYGIVINLSPRVFGEFTLGKKARDLSDFVALFDMGAHTLDSLIALFASFSIDHDQYVMTNAAGYHGFTMADVCFDLVTGSSFVNQDSAGLFQVRDSYVFFEAIKRQVSAGRLRMVEDCELFGELLRKTGADQELINYFIKPISLISAAEAFAFRNSEYALFMDDRFVAGMAALDETSGDDTTATEETTDPAPEGTDPAATDSEFSEEPTSAEEEKPQIDPKMMLLELVKPSETMSDYLFRELVSRRIGSILKNPPENAMPNDLLMLKRWRSRWIYLASVACLRDFLTRVSIRLSDA